MSATLPGPGIEKACLASIHPPNQVQGQIDGLLVRNHTITPVFTLIAPVVDGGVHGFGVRWRGS